MEFPFNIGVVVGTNDVFLAHKSLNPFKKDGSGQNQKSLCQIIDQLGVASAVAQHLPGPITTSNKLTFTDQRVYIYAEQKDGRNCVIGFIKVGVKKLFLYDHKGQQKEVSPLCVLDFYVHESKQRMGYGKLLFEHMLRQEQINPVHMAVDRPSEKFTAFLTKHYKLRATIPQVNNYVIFEGFFSQRTDNAVKRNRRTQSPHNEPVNRSKSGHSHNALTSSSHNSKTGLNSNSQLSGTNGHSISSSSQLHYITSSNNGSQQSLKSLSSTTSSNSEELAALSNIPLERPSSREKLIGKYNGGSPAEDSSVSYVPKTLPNSAVDHTTKSSMMYPTSNDRSLLSHSAQNRAYSRHTSTALPYQYSTTNQSDYHEPIRTRSGQRSANTLNQHQSALNRQGQLKVMSASPQRAGTVERPSEAHEWSRTFHNTGKVYQQNSSWNIFGVPPGYSHIANRSPL